MNHRHGRFGRVTGRDPRLRPPAPADRIRDDRATLSRAGAPRCGCRVRSGRRSRGGSRPATATHPIRREGPARRAGSGPSGWGPVQEDQAVGDLGHPAEELAAVMQGEADPVASLAAFDEVFLEGERIRHARSIGGPPRRRTGTGRRTQSAKHTAQVRRTGVGGRSGPVPGRHRRLSGRRTGVGHRPEKHRCRGGPGRRRPAARPAPDPRSGEADLIDWPRSIPRG